MFKFTTPPCDPAPGSGKSCNRQPVDRRCPVRYKPHTPWGRTANVQPAGTRSCCLPPARR